MPAWQNRCFSVTVRDGSIDHQVELPSRRFPAQATRASFFVTSLTCNSMPHQLNRTCFALLIVALISCGTRNSTPSRPIPILLFNGTGVSPNDIAAIEAILNNNHLEYAKVNSSELNTMSSSQLKAYRLLLMPGGDFMEMGNNLEKATSANVRLAVKSGLNYLGICAGAFLAGKSTYYNGFDLTSGTTFGFYVAENKGIRKAAVAITDAKGETLDQYWENGPQLSGWGEVLAKYPDGTPAVVQGNCGNGMVVLVGIHAEAPESWRRQMMFNTTVAADNAYAIRIIRTALNAAPRPQADKR